MNILNILNNRLHYTSPFTLRDHEGDKIGKLSTKEKVAAVALSIIPGILIPGIGGVVAFYVATAFFKSRYIRPIANANLISNPPDSVPTQSRDPKDYVNPCFDTYMNKSIKRDYLGNTEFNEFKPSVIDSNLSAEEWIKENKKHLLNDPRILGFGVNSMGEIALQIKHPH